MRTEQRDPITIKTRHLTTHILLREVSRSDFGCALRDGRPRPSRGIVTTLTYILSNNKCLSTICQWWSPISFCHTTGIQSSMYLRKLKQLPPMKIKITKWSSFQESSSTWCRVHNPHCKGGQPKLLQGKCPRLLHAPRLSINRGTSFEFVVGDLILQDRKQFAKRCPLEESTGSPS